VGCVLPSEWSSSQYCLTNGPTPLSSYAHSHPQYSNRQYPPSPPLPPSHPFPVIGTPGGHGQQAQSSKGIRLTVTGSPTRLALNLGRGKG
jgi:hypothetical protein